MYIITRKIEAAAAAAAAASTCQNHKYWGHGLQHLLVRSFIISWLIGSVERYLWQSFTNCKWQRLLAGFDLGHFSNFATTFWITAYVAAWWLVTGQRSFCDAKRHVWPIENELHIPCHILKNCYLCSCSECCCNLFLEEVWITRLCCQLVKSAAQTVLQR